MGMDQLLHFLLNPLGGRSINGPELVSFLLACYGVTFLLCGSSLLQTPRVWLRGRSKTIDQLVTCYFCTGFWVAVLIGFWLFRWSPWTIVYGFAGASSSFLLNSLHQLIDNVSDWVTVQKVLALDRGEADE